MTETLQILILLLAVISIVALVAKRLKVPPAILLVITGAPATEVPPITTTAIEDDARHA
jgi:hypothetical protein